MKPLKKLYLPLNQDPISNDDNAGREKAEKSEWAGKAFTIVKRNILTLLLAVSNILLIWLSFSARKGEESPAGYAEVESLPVKWTRFDWWTEYSDKNASHVDALWDAILPSHGFVAMDTSWAIAHQWPESMRLPSDATKSVYLLEAYHQLHCIRIIRKTFWEVVRGEPVTYPVSHAGHCFDMIRQYIECNADNTPLYTFGDDTAGDGQLHRCRDWNALRDFATEHTACYRDSAKPIILGNHFGYCDDGNDGVIDAKRANVTYTKNAWG